MTALVDNVRRLERHEVRRFLPLLDQWLLPGAAYGVAHTWPQLYRGDGAGHFLAITDGERLLSHCAYREATLWDAGSERSIALLGSVATAPNARGRGLAGRVLRAALESLRGEVDAVLLWAERHGLYERLGFRPTGDDACLLINRPTQASSVHLRLASPSDFEALHALHHQKIRHVQRSKRAMSTMLTTPGMATFVLERDGRPVAYACTGKGADLQGYWHELGGSDQDLAVLIPAAMHATDQRRAALLLPPYRPALRGLLAPYTVEEAAASGPMIFADNAAVGPCWIDGLDSI